MAIKLESPHIAVALQELTPTHAELVRAIVRDLQVLQAAAENYETRLQIIELALGL